MDRETLADLLYAELMRQRKQSSFEDGLLFIFEHSSKQRTVRIQGPVDLLKMADSVLRALPEKLEGTE